MAIKYKCLCCAFEQEFEDAEAAFQAGWDIPPYFTVVQPLCNLCPAADVVINGLDAARKRHAEAHARWAKDGRPEEFEFEKELKLNGSKETPEEVMAKGQAIVDSFKDNAPEGALIPRVILAPGMQEDLDANPELQGFMQKFIVDAKNAMQAVKDGRHPDFGKAMEALGYAASKHASMEDAMEADDDDA